MNTKRKTVGNTTNVILTYDEDSTIIYKAHGGKISNLTLRCEREADATDETPCSCIEVDNGQFEIENCTISCTTGSAILAMNKYVDIVFFNNMLGQN